MSSKGKSHRWPHRRDVLKAGATLAGSAALPRALVDTASAAASNTLVIAAPATPQSLDCNFDVSLGTFEAVAALYDNLLEFKKIPDPKSQAHSARTSRIIRICRQASPFRGNSRSRSSSIPRQIHPLPAAQGGQEQLGQRADRRRREMDLGPQVRARSAIGAFYLSTLGLENRTGSKSKENTRSRSISINPNPLLAKLQPNLYAPIYDSKKCKEVSNADDQWARKFIENNSAGFGPYRLDQLQRGQQAVFKARRTIIGRQARDGHRRYFARCRPRPPAPRCCKAAPSISRNICSRWRSSNCAASRM